MLFHDRRGEKSFNTRLVTVIAAVVAVCIISVIGFAAAVSNVDKSGNTVSVEEQGADTDSDSTQAGETGAILEEIEKPLFIRTETITVTEEIPFEYKKRNNANMTKGETAIAQKGVKGSAQVVYKITYENGVKKGREQVEKTVIRPSVAQITDVGTKGVVQTSRGDSFRYRDVIRMNATGYDLSYESCGKRPGDRGYGITASGMKAQYGVVSVDPKVIPLGTRLYIESPDGSWVYGNAVAGDTGASIKGNRVDLFFDSRAAALRFGRRSVNVYILE